MARLLAKPLGEELGEPVFVDNKPGASGILAAEFVKRAPADGHTLFYTSTSTLTINPAVYKRLAYDTLVDFAPVAFVGSTPFYLAVNPSVPATNVRELVAFIKAHPGKLSYGSGGSGSTQHLTMEWFKTIAGLDIVHVPYKGSPAAATDLIGGQVQVMLDTATLLMPHSSAQRIRLLGITDGKRSAIAPSVATLGEQGYPQIVASGWTGLVVPAATPSAIVSRLTIAMQKAVSRQEVVSAIVSAGTDVAFKGPEAFRALMVSEIARWQQVARSANAQVD